MRSNPLLTRKCGLGYSHGTLIALLGSVLMHLLLEQWSETMSVPVDGPAAHTRFSATVALYTYDFALVFIEAHTHGHACSVICLCPPVRTEGCLALLKSLMARLWHPL